MVPWLRLWVAFYRVWKPPFHHSTPFLIENLLAKCLLSHELNWIWKIHVLSSPNPLESLQNLSPFQKYQQNYPNFSLSQHPSFPNNFPKSISLFPISTANVVFLPLFSIMMPPCTWEVLWRAVVLILSGLQITNFPFLNTTLTIKTQPKRILKFQPIH